MTARRVTWILVGAFAVYALLLADRAVLLIRDGRPPFVLLGIGVMLLPVVGIVLVRREVLFGLATQRLARALEADGRLPVDELPRLASGRVDASGADEVFARRRADVESAPEDPAVWFALAVAYGDARDTRRGREAMRHALELFDHQPN